MTRHTRKQQEIIAIVMAAAAGEASAEQLARISRLVLEDDQSSTFVLQLMSQEAWLTWHASEARATGHRVSGGEPTDDYFDTAELAGQGLPLATKRETLGGIIARSAAAQPFIQEPNTEYRPVNSSNKGQISLVCVVGRGCVVAHDGNHIRCFSNSMV